jgi:hypothetical protein
MPLNPGAGGVKVNAAHDQKEKTSNVINHQSGSLHHMPAKKTTRFRYQKKVSLQKNG